jgi:hypothetical protein
MKLPTYKQLRGAPKKYTAEALWDKFLDYVKDNETDTMKRVELIKAGELAGVQKHCDLKVPLSIGGFCTFALINFQTFLNYESEEQTDKDLFEVTTRIHKIIETEQVNGANIGLYNANIVARINGLSDNVNVTTTEQPNINITIGNDAMSLKRN